jgi:iron complex transport system permease protein
VTATAPAAPAPATPPDPFAPPPAGRAGPQRPAGRPSVRAFRLGGIGLRVDTRVLGLGGAGLLLLLVVGAWGMTLGKVVIPVDAVIRSVAGVGPRETDFIVLTLRFPRVLTAALIGAMLGMAGAIFQGLVRNPLVSPDVIGINAGAGLAAVAWIVTGQNQAYLPAVAFAGAVLAAAAVYVLSWTGHLAGARLVLVGIGVNALLAAGTTFLIVRYPIDRVSSAVLWQAGTVYGADWNDVRLLGVVLAVLAPLAIGLMWSLRVLQLGDTTARTLGLPLERTRLALAVVGCALCATAVSIGGTIGFVAFLVPHVARMLAGPMTGGVMLLTAVIGALLLLGADLVGQHALPVALPVGVVTAALGAPFFLFLLYRTNARL